MMPVFRMSEGRSDLEIALAQRDSLVKSLRDTLAYIDLHQEICQFDPPEITAARELAAR